MDIELALLELEARIGKRARHRGRWVFYQMLEVDLLPILAACSDPDGVRARVRVMLERFGHAPKAPPLPAGGRGGDAAPLCRPSPLA